MCLSDVMVTLNSSVPVLKMEGLVKLCAESLHVVLLGLCTRYTNMQIEFK